MDMGRIFIQQVGYGGGTTRTIPALLTSLNKAYTNHMSPRISLETLLSSTFHMLSHNNYHPKLNTSSIGKKYAISFSQSQVKIRN